MFGPNVKSDERNVSYHHREGNFHVILSSLENLFANKFSLTDYNYLFITGSGTLVNEAVIFSLNDGIHPLFTDAEFGARLMSLANTHNNSKHEGMFAYPYYETSISRLNISDERPVFLDMVSAFPYYLPPKGTLIWTTVSSKQLSAYPVLGIVAIHKSLDVSKLCGERRSAYSYLNIKYHFDFRAKQETLATPAIPLYYDLLQTLTSFYRKDFIEMIKNRRWRLSRLIDLGEIVGVGPVLSVKESEKMNRIGKEFNLYKSKANLWQIFLWSGTVEEYQSLYEALGERK